MRARAVTPSVHYMKELQYCFAAALAVFAFITSARAEVEWKPESNMDGQLFPSLILATATVRPDDEEEPDPNVLGDAYGLLGISIKAPSANAKVKVTVRENEVISTSSWSGTLAEAGGQYWVAPRINYKFGPLRNAHQQVPLNVTFDVVVNGKSAGEQTETITVRSINDCPFRVADSEAAIEEEEGEEEEEEEEDASGGRRESRGLAVTTEAAAREEQVVDDGADPEYTDLSWMFAAYVNENSPIIDQILKEALATRIVNGFSGYQGGREDVLREMFAIWKALQDRGIKYSNITTTPASSPIIYSQHVRFVDESLASEQANCVDGSVLFCSVLRKLGIRSFLVSVPGHMFMGAYLTRGGDERVALETTVLGISGKEAEEPSVPRSLAAVRKSLSKETRESGAWKTFLAAFNVGTETLVKHEAKFEAQDDLDYQIIDINENRRDGIMPIAHQKAR